MNPCTRTAPCRTISGALAQGARRSIVAIDPADLGVAVIATGIVISQWLVLIVAVVAFLIGTLIRTRFEERLLSDAFGEKFVEWRSRVPGLIPFLKSS